jgi:hypothetical protein
METNKISAHQVRAFRCLENAGDAWMTNNEIAKTARVAPRTARAITKKFVELGVLDLAEVFSAQRYRMSPLAEKRNRGYLTRLQQAAEVLNNG